VALPHPLPRSLVGAGWRLPGRHPPVKVQGGRRSVKLMEKSTWHLPGNGKGDLQVALVQDLDGGHRHLQLGLLPAVSLGVRGQGDDVPSPFNLAARVGCESRGAGRSRQGLSPARRSRQGLSPAPELSQDTLMPWDSHVPSRHCNPRCGTCAGAGSVPSPGCDSRASGGCGVPGTQTPPRSPPW